MIEYYPQKYFKFLRWFSQTDHFFPWCIVNVSSIAYNMKENGQQERYCRSLNLQCSWKGKTPGIGGQFISTRMVRYKQPGFQALRVVRNVSKASIYWAKDIRNTPTCTSFCLRQSVVTHWNKEQLWLQVVQVWPGESVQPSLWPPGPEQTRKWIQNMKKKSRVKWEHLNLTFNIILRIQSGLNLKKSHFKMENNDKSSMKISS